MEWIARLVGAFYIFAGVMTVRQAIFNWRLERIFGPSWARRRQKRLRM